MAIVPARGVRRRPPDWSGFFVSCNSRLPAGAKPARLKTKASPNVSGVGERVFEHGAAGSEAANGTNSQGRCSVRC